MMITNPTRRDSRRAGHRGLPGPELSFGAALIIVVVVWAVAIGTLQSNLAMPAISTLFLLLAVALAVVAWMADDRADQDRVTYWDAAGALILIGVCASALIDPDQLVRLFEGGRRDK